MHGKLEMTDVTGRALEHYAEQVTKLQEDDEIRAGNDIIRKDMEEIAKEAKEIKNNMTPMTVRITIEDHKEMILAALQSYIGDMEESIKGLQAKLGGRVTLKNTLIELNQARQIRKYALQTNMTHVQLS